MYHFRLIKERCLFAEQPMGIPVFRYRHHKPNIQSYPKSSSLKSLLLSYWCQCIYFSPFTSRLNFTQHETSVCPESSSTAGCWTADKHTVRMCSSNSNLRGRHSTLHSLTLVKIRQNVNHITLFESNSRFLQKKKGNWGKNPSNYNAAGSITGKGLDL